MAIWQDLKFAVRILLKDPFLAFVAILALGLGIGANATVFTCVNAVLLRGLPYPHAGRIFHINAQNKTDGDDTGVSYLDLLDMRNQSRGFESLAGFQTATMNVSDSGLAPERYSGVYVTANLFDLLRQPPRIGRTFARGEDRQGAERVVVISHRMWTQRYGAKRDIIGRTLKVNEIPATVIGVMPEGFQFPMTSDLWQPLTGAQVAAPRDDHAFNVIALARSGVTLAQAQSEMKTIAERLARQYPDTNKNIGAHVMTFNDRFNGGPIKLVFSTLMGAVAFVLLIACANVANLLLARSAGRSREIAVRVSLGATRWRVVRQLLVESLILAVLAAGLGLAIASVGVRLFDQAVADTGKPYWIVFTIDYKVLAFLGLVCVGTAVLFGLAPALHVSRTDINETLKQGGRGGGTGRRARRLSTTLVVVEMALALVLMTGAGLMIRSFLALYSMDLGFRPERIQTAALLLAEKKYPNDAAWNAFHDRLVERMSAAPGVSAWAVASNLPVGGGTGRELEIEGQHANVGLNGPNVTVVAIGPGYFDTLDVRMRAGRGFRSTDGQASAENVIVNERWVEKFSQGRDPLGRRIRLKNEDHPAPWLTIVGVSPSIRQNSARAAESATPVVYVPFRFLSDRFTFIMARGGNPSSLGKVIQAEVRAVDGDQPVFRVMTVAESLARERWPYRVFGGLFAIFALIALGLSMLGVYAVTSYSVAQRTAEIGVRMALGASGRALAWLVLRRAAIQAVVGLVIGAAAGFGLSRVLTSILVEGTAGDLFTYAAVVGAFVITSLVASIVPAMRATKLDPLVVLRTE